MIPRLRPTLGAREALAPFNASLGGVREFEEAFARAVGAAHAVAFPYGRMALHALLAAQGVKGKRIALPAYTCVVVAHAVVLSGNIPLFVDIESGGCNMDLADLERKLTPDTAVVLPTAMFGHPMDPEAVRTLAGDRLVVQDCALALGTTWQGRPLCSWGDAAIWGLNVGKQATSLQGGMLTTDDAALHERILRHREAAYAAPAPAAGLRWLAYLYALYPAFTPGLYGFVEWLGRKTPLLDGQLKYYDEHSIELPEDAGTGMCATQARVGTVQMRRLADMTRRRRAQARAYDEGLAGIEGLELPAADEGASYSHYTVRVADRSPFLASLAADGIQAGTLFDYVVPHLAAYEAYRGDSLFPRAEALASRAVNLPLYPLLSSRAHDRIIQAVHKALRA